MKNTLWIVLAEVVIVLMIWPFDLTFGLPYNQHDFLQNFLLRAGMTWITASWSYYAILFCISAGLAVYFYIRPHSLPFWKRLLRSTAALAIPLVFACLFNPIYEDMLFDQSFDMSNHEALEDYSNADLVLIAIPDCPYCMRAIEDVRTLHKRNANMRIRMVVCTQDSTWLIPYLKQADGACEVSSASNINVMATHAGGHFPAFVQVKDGKPLRRWNNNAWGPLAKDCVELGTR